MSLEFRRFFRRQPRKSSRSNDWQIGSLEPRLMLAGDAGAEIADLMLSSSQLDQAGSIGRWERLGTRTVPIVINAWGQTGEERFNVWVNDEVVGTYQAATHWIPFQVQAEVTGGVESIRVEFLNDLYTPDTDRNLFVNNIQVDGVNYETASDQTFSDGTWTAEDEIVPGFGRGITLHANGHFRYDITHDDQTVVEVRARGTEGGERFRVSYGNRSYEFTASTEFQTFYLTTDETLELSDIRIDFLNDRYEPENGIDANLIVDRVGINGNLYETEAASTYAEGVWNGSEITTGFWQTQQLSTNGFFQFGARADSPLPQFDAAFNNETGKPLEAGANVLTETSDGGFAAATPFEVSRVNSSGDLVTSFGNGGVVDLASLGIAGYDSFATVITDIDATADGGLLLTGANSFDFQNAQYVLLIKLDASGNLDPNFASGFRSDVPVIGLFGDSLKPESIVQADGRIVVVGNGRFTDPSSRPRLTFTRLNADGSPDATTSLRSLLVRDSSGQVVTPFTIFGADQDAQGNILVAAGFGDKVSVFRVDDNLNSVTLAGQDFGVVATRSDFETAEFAVDHNGNFAIFGYVYAGAGSEARMLTGTGDGNLIETDLAGTFAFNGETGLSFRSGRDVGLEFAADVDVVVFQNQVVQTGKLTFRYQGILMASVNVAGGLDTPFGLEGRELLDVVSLGVTTMDSQGAMVIAAHEATTSGINLYGPVSLVRLIV